ncbi:MAG: hypothetical protein IJ572_02260 [Bacilli bacterium]|nr:hypothetical protein [Bacilli bacterium]
MTYYSSDIKKDLTHLEKCKYFDEWLDIVKEILLNDEFQKRKYFRHHKGRLWDHVTEVSYYSFLMAKVHHADSKVCAIAGLLHDFYPKAYKYSKELDEIDHDYVTDVKKKQSIFKMHGFSHAEAAAINSKKYFPNLVDDKIFSIIKTHMFPLNISKIPKYKEGWIVTYVDKKLSIGLINKIRYMIDKDKKTVDY